ncbi:MAG: DUF521 domain-containing protein [Spirochaetaceae bacterium]|nr:MAG: DUF521 domain-containing protein [Spirochaetaceae bacterium]
MPKREYRCRKVVGGVGEGPALVADTRISFWGGFDPNSGRIIEVGNPLEGRAIDGSIMVFRSTKGSSGTSRVLRLARSAGHFPAAFINNELDELSVLTCVAQRLPMVIDFESDPFTDLTNGEWLRVDADRGFVTAGIPEGERLPGIRSPADDAFSVEMELTAEQWAMLRGEAGPDCAEYLRTLIHWGQACGARRLLRVENVMPSALDVPDRSMGDVPYQLIQENIDYTKSCLRNDVRATAFSHIASMDLRRVEKFGSDQRQVPDQAALIDMAHNIGLCLTWSCAPYLLGNVPVKGQICAWTESHAVVYINSILGARTTRHGNESSVAAMATGWVPEFGVLLTENRRARILIHVACGLENDADWGCLGFFAGKAGGLRIPAFTGLPSPRLEAARQLSAALATSGGAAMFHIAGVTPESPTLEAALQDREPEDTYTFGRKELSRMYNELRTTTGSDVDLVYFGCPHATLQEVVEVAVAIRGRRVHKRVTLVVSMSYAVEMQARRLGFIQEIEEAGGFIMTDTCPTNVFWPPCRRMATPSVKTCYYAQNLLGCEGYLAALPDCIRIAETGRIA